MPCRTSRILRNSCRNLNSAQNYFACGVLLTIDEVLYYPQSDLRRLLGSLLPPPRPWLKFLHQAFETLTRYRSAELRFALESSECTSCQKWYFDSKDTLFDLESTVRCGLFFLLLSGGYLPSVLRGALGNGSPRTAEDNRPRALPCHLPLNCCTVHLNWRIIIRKYYQNSA